MKRVIVLFFCQIFILSLSAQEAGWGFSYTDLQNKIAEWQKSDLVVVDTIGFSVENRALFRLTIQSKTAKKQKYRIAIHARTHPLEVQSSHVTNQIIQQLLSNDEMSQLLLDSCVFNIIPMYNPDGVSHGIGYERINADSVDIESNWNVDNPEKEVIALRKSFVEYMASSLPVSIALNMHSAYYCWRYFVVHDGKSTGAAYFQKEKLFVSAVKSYWPDGIEAWNKQVTWSTSVPKQYPESWFWLNYKDQVLALTYEDMNCVSAGDYDKTAHALLGGIKDYLYKLPIVIVDGVSISPIVYEDDVIQLYPNPAMIGDPVTVNFNDNANQWHSVRLIASSGQVMYEERVQSFPIRISTINLSQGVYNLQLISEDSQKSIKLLIK